MLFIFSNERSLDKLIFQAFDRPIAVNIKGGFPGKHPQNKVCFFSSRFLLTNFKKH